MDGIAVLFIVVLLFAFVGGVLILCSYFSPDTMAAIGAPPVVDNGILVAGIFMTAIGGIPVALFAFYGIGAIVIAIQECIGRRKGES